MKKKELKIILKLAKDVFIATSLVWFIETIVFLIIEGWHIKATNPIEISIDKTIIEIYHFVFYLVAWVCINYLINLNKK